MAYFALFLFALGIIFSYPLFTMEWVWDDHTLIKGNPLVHDFEWQDLPQIFSSRYFSVPGHPGGKDQSPYGYYRPLAVTAYAVLYQVGEGRAWVFHLALLLAHWMVTILLVSLIRPFFQNPLGWWLAGIFFFLHPVHHQVIFYATGLLDLQSALLGLCSLFLLIRYLQGRMGILALLLSWLCYTFALFTKETVLLLPLFAPLHCQLAPSNWHKRQMGALIGFFAACGSYFWLRNGLLGLSLIGQQSLLQPLPYYGSAAWLFLRSVMQSVSPAFTWFFKSRLPLLNSGWALFAGMGCVLFLVLFIRYAKSSKLGCWCGLWFGLLYLPLSNLVPLDMRQVSRYLYFPEHLLYLASFAGTCVLSAILLGGIRLLNLTQKGRFKILAARIPLFFLLMFGWQFLRMSMIWQHDGSLHQFRLHQQPFDLQASQGLAYYYATHGQKERAAQILNEALGRKGTISQEEIYLKMLTNLASLQLEMGAWDKVEANCQVILQFWPTNYYAWYLLAEVYRMQARESESMECLNRVFELNPQYLPARESEQKLIVGN